jgi:hypothetical protein
METKCTYPPWLENRLAEHKKMQIQASAGEIVEDRWGMKRAEIEDRLRVVLRGVGNASEATRSK